MHQENLPSDLSIIDLAFQPFITVLLSLIKFLKIALLPSLIIAVLSGLVGFIFLPFLSSLPMIFLWIVAFLALGVPSTAVACSYHRHLLLGENADRTGIGFYFGGSEITYLMRTFLIGMIIFFGASISGLFVVGGVITSVLSIGILAVTVAIAVRFSLAPPAAAIGQDHITLGHSWRKTQPVKWPLFYGALIYSLISGLIFWAIQSASMFVFVFVIFSAISTDSSLQGALMLIASVFLLVLVFMVSVACHVAFMTKVYTDLEGWPSSRAEA